MAQDSKDDLNNPLSDSEIHEIKLPLNSPFRCYALADSFSRLSDSVNASKFFVEIDPCYFLFENQTPATISEFISNRLNVTKASKEKYLHSYTKYFASKKSEAFNKFREMEEEDQDGRRKLERCKDSACYSLMAADISHKDSVHFDYLYKYIIKHGWPSLANGSQYASILAIHDHDHHEAYIPILKKAVLDGQAELITLKYVNYWFQVKRKYEYLDEYIGLNRYFMYDISSLMKDELPGSLKEIEKTVSQHCPVNTYMICKCRDSTKFWNWILKMYSITNENVLATMTSKVSKYECGINPEMLQIITERGLWTVHWRHGDHEDLRLYMYITYDDSDANVVKFNQFIRDKKFITHPIHFEENKSAILPGDIEFLNRLVAWLRHNPLTKLELDGHTDKEGTTASNMKLSMARANEVKNKLVALGIDANRLTTKGFGVTEPLQSNGTQEGKAANRRVEFIIVKD